MKLNVYYITNTHIKYVYVYTKIILNKNVNHDILNKNSSAQYLSNEIRYLNIKTVKKKTHQCKTYIFSASLRI